MGNSKAEIGGVVETVGYISAFKTIDCPTTGNVSSTSGRIEITNVVKIHISSESFERRVIFADNEEDISTKLTSEDARLYKADEEIILDVAAHPNKYVYIGTTESSDQTNGIRASFYNV